MAIQTPLLLRLMLRFPGKNYPMRESLPPVGLEPAEPYTGNNQHRDICPVTNGLVGVGKSDPKTFGLSAGSDFCLIAPKH